MTIAPSSTDLAKLSLLATLMGPRDVATEGAPGKSGKLWHVTIIKAGVALTGDEYPAEVLAESLDIFRGLPIYSFRFGDDASDDPASGFHHLPEGASGDPRGQPTGNLIGQVTDEVWWNEAEQAIEALAAIDDSKVRDRLKNAHARGAIGKGAEVDVFGFSIFAEVLKSGKRVAKFVKGNSLDLVTRPAAGGAFVNIVAEAPPSSATPLLETLRAETDLDENAVRGIVLEEFTAQAGAIAADTTKTKDERMAALVALAEELTGSERDGELEVLVSEAINAARAAIEDPRPKEQNIMDAATITKLVAEQVTAGIAKARAEDAEAAEVARAASPLEALKAWLEGLAGEERMSALQQIQGMLESMGAAVEGEGAGLGADDFAALTAELKAVTEEKDGKVRRARLTKVLEGLTGTNEQTAEGKELERMRAEMRNMAITRELDKLTPELRLRDATAALMLADVTGVTVNGMEVAGLRESLETLIKDKPYLVEAAIAEAPEGATGGADDKAPTADALEAAKAEAEAAATKAAELQALSAATIRESVGAGGIAAIPGALQGKIKDLQMRARQGDIGAALEYKRIRSKLIGGAA